MIKLVHVADAPRECALIADTAFKWNLGPGPLQPQMPALNFAPNIWLFVYNLLPTYQPTYLATYLPTYQQHAPKLCYIEGLIHAR